MFSLPFFGWLMLSICHKFGDNFVVGLNLKILFGNCQVCKFIFTLEGALPLDKSLTLESLWEFFWRGTKAKIEAIEAMTSVATMSFQVSDLLFSEWAVIVLY